MNYESFNNVEKWYKDFIEKIGLNTDDNSNINFPFILLGNKNDMKDDIKVKEKDINKFRQRHNNMPYFPCSAKKGTNIDKCFNTIEDIAYHIITEKYNDHKLPKSKNSHIEDDIKKKNFRSSYCC